MYYDDVVHALETVPERDRDAAVAILSRLMQLMNEKEQSNE